MKRFWHWWRYDFGLNHLFILMMLPAILAFVGWAAWGYIGLWYAQPIEALLTTVGVMFVVGCWGLFIRNVP